MSSTAGISTDKWNAPRECVKCKKRYKEADEIFRLNCREHPGFIVNGEWSCCGLKTNAASRRDYYSRFMTSSAMGCIKSDHLDDSEPGMYGIPAYSVLHGRIEFPRSVLKTYEINPVVSENCRNEDDNAHYIICYRYQKKKK